MPVPGGGSIVLNPTLGWFVMTVVTLIAGTVFVMWLGEQITEFGIGNGISLIIFAGIIDRFPSAVKGVIDLLRNDERSIIAVLLMLAVVVVVIGLVVWLETAQRKIPVQYAKRVVGRKMYGGASTFLPLKVEQSGVIAVIFAVSLLSLPMTLTQFFPEAVWAQRFSDIWTRGGLIYEAIFAALIIFFCYFYNSVAFNPVDLAENMKKSGGFIPGIRPGDHTAEYIQKIVERITLGGALGVVAIAILPDYMRKIFDAPFFFGGTSLLIVVGVALDTIGQIESHLIMRHYEGFMKQGRIKGRWFNAR
jgi:preprotein translocase subunit SecY